MWLRTSIIEGVGQLEAGLDQVIAMHFSLDEGHREILEKDLLPRVPLSARISTLTKLLDWHMRLQNYPFFALLPKAIEHRNVVAHMTLDIQNVQTNGLSSAGGVKARCKPRNC